MNYFNNTPLHDWKFDWYFLQSKYPEAEFNQAPNFKTQSAASPLLSDPPYTYSMPKYQFSNSSTSASDIIDAIQSIKAKDLSEYVNNDLKDILGDRTINVTDITVTGKPINILHDEVFTVNIDYRIIEKAILDSLDPIPMVPPIPEPMSFREPPVQAASPDAVGSSGVWDWKTASKDKYNFAGTKTGRFSSQEPALQRIPAKNSKWGSPFIKVKPTKSLKRRGYKDFWKRYNHQRYHKSLFNPKFPQFPFDPSKLNVSSPDHIPQINPNIQIEQPCSCEMMILMRHGCQCGGF